MPDKKEPKSLLSKAAPKNEAPKPISDKDIEDIIGRKLYYFKGFGGKPNVNPFRVINRLLALRSDLVGGVSPSEIMATLDTIKEEEATISTIKK